MDRFSSSSVVERSINSVLGRGSGAIAMLMGMLITMLVQSSSITTSILIPLVASGLLLVTNAFPITLGANVGTTITALLAAFAAGTVDGLAIAFVVVCRTRKQADTLGQMLVLIVSAVGGSMVPRFLMPPEIQTLGWLTPNTWALEAYSSLFWRGDTMEAMLTPWAVLAGIAVASVLSLAQKLLDIEELGTVGVRGAGGLTGMALVLLLALTLGAVTRELGTGDYVAGIVGGRVPLFLLVPLVFRLLSP